MYILLLGALIIGPFLLAGAWLRFSPHTAHRALRKLVASLLPPSSSRDAPRVSSLASDHRENIVTVFSQGIGASLFQAALYTGQAGIEYRYPDDSEQIHHTVAHGAHEFVHNVYTNRSIDNDLEHIVYFPSSSWNPVHWLTALFTTLWFLYKGVEQAPIYHYALGAFDMSTRASVEHHQQMVARCAIDHPNQRIVLFGHSCGSAITLLSLATMVPDLQRRVALVVLEAPYDTVENALRGGSWFASLWLYLLRHWTQFDDRTYHRTPLQSAAEIPIDVPVAVVRSVNDTYVQSVCTERVIEALRGNQAAHRPLYELVLSCSHKRFHSPENENEIDRYLVFLDQLYRKHIPPRSTAECEPFHPPQQQQQHVSDGSH